VFTRFLLLPFLFAASALAAGPVDFSRDVQPIISEKCYQCHGPDEDSRKAKMRLDVREDAMKERDGFRAIVPGKPEESELIVRIASKDPDEVMPPPKEHHALTAQEVDTLRRWIAEGAGYAKHWAFIPPKAELVSGSEGAGANPIDGFIQGRLVKEGLKLSPEADAHTLCRRLYLDLTGLPPTPAEVDAFVQSASGNRHEAVERLVAKLLASPAYGEKWARMWLDLARYADSTGYGSDKFRMNVWPYRDWVIDAFNRNMPYDQFTIEQLAGDLLPNPTREQLVATAFHRNTMTQNEGGTDDEEYRVAAVKDRVAVTGQVWMGLTFGCAQCHTHKFDPISHREYYAMYAVFNQSEDADREDEEPKMPLPTKEEQAKMDGLNADIAKLETSLKETSEALESELHEWEAKMHDPVPWKVLAPAAVDLNGQTKMIVKPDGTIHPSETEPKTYTVRVRGPLKGVTGFRLEALLDDAKKGPGRLEHGNFALSDLRVKSAPIEVHGIGVRYIRVEHQSEKILHLAEIQAFAGGENVAQKGAAKLSSTGFGGVAPRLIDGNTNGDYEKNSVAHTDDGDKAPFAEIDLGSEKMLHEVVLWNRTDANTDERIKGAKLILLDEERKAVYERTLSKFKADAKFALTGEKNIELRNASADFEQKEHGAAGAIDASIDTDWGIAPATGKPHALAVETGSPVDVPEDRELVFTLTQKTPGHTLGRFRLSATTKAPPVRELPPSIMATIALEPSERSQQQREELIAYFRPLSKVDAETRKTIEARRTELAAIKPVKLPVMRERAADKRRVSHILNKGNFMAPGEVVEPGVPAEFKAALAVEGGRQVDRLTVARWLLSPENPMTARVTVNRFWAQFFGTGIVETEEDFGTQGALPSHPELLDWLAVAFRTPKAEGGLGWDVQALLKLIVTSQTYRQSSVITAEHLQKDPRNRLLAHYPRRRLEAEAIRDQAMALSGLLSRKIGGPSVYPPQPGGLWSVAFNGGQNTYPVSKGDDRYRRGLYTFWRRIAPNPTMSTFDAPSRETCTLRRLPTNTPLQAFVTLNDPVFVEAAQALARRIVREGGDTAEARIRWALNLSLARPATDEQVAALRKLHDSELLAYQQDPDAAKKLATDPLGPLPEGLDASEVAAWTAVANVLLNLDGVLTKS
jgi:hypothetical protein